MDFIERNLRSNEVIKSRASISMKPLIPTFLTAFLLLIICTLTGIFIVGLLAAAITVIINIARVKSNQLAITNSKFIGKTGIFVINALEAPLEKIDSMTVVESFWGNIFNYASLQICTTSSKIRFNYVEDAIAFKNNLLDEIDAKSLLRNASTVTVTSVSQSWQCKTCGEVNNNGASFCRKCGQQI